MAHRQQPQAARLRRGTTPAAFSSGCQRHRPQPARQLQVSAAAAAAPALGLTGCKLVGVGSSTPATVLSNADLAKFVDTNDEWISSRTGIKRRHVLAEGETMGSHAADACRKALEMAGVSAADVSIVLMATSTPDDAFGSACQVRELAARQRAHLVLAAAGVLQPPTASLAVGMRVA